jgi:hypothetical protein
MSKCTRKSFITQPASSISAPDTCHIYAKQQNVRVAHLVCSGNNPMPSMRQSRKDHPQTSAKPASQLEIDHKYSCDDLTVLVASIEVCFGDNVVSCLVFFLRLC